MTPTDVDDPAIETIQDVAIAEAIEVMERGGVKLPDRELTAAESRAIERVSNWIIRSTIAANLLEDVRELGAAMAVREGRLVLIRADGSETELDG